MRELTYYVATSLDGIAAPDGTWGAFLDEGDHMDVPVDHAGHGAVGAIEKTAEQEARDIVDTNFFGALWLSQAAVEVMRPRRSGHIVQISTVGAVGTIPTLGLYAASKWALARRLRDYRRDERFGAAPHEEGAS